MEPTNPYQAPTAAVTTVDETAAAIIQPARRVRAGQGGAWLNFGFAAVSQGLIGWILLFLALGVVYGAVLVAGELLGQIHFVLSFLPSLVLYPFLTIVWGGVMVACHHAPLTFRKVMNAAQAHLGPLTVLGVLSAVISIATMIPWLVIGGAGATFLVDSDLTASPGMIIGFVVLIFAIFALVTACLWFSPALVALGNVSPWTAIKRSFTACFKNTPAFIVLVLFLVVLLLAAMLLVGLIFAIIIGVLGFATSFEGLGSAAGLSGIVFGMLFYVAALFLFVSVIGAAQYASFKDVFAYALPDANIDPDPGPSPSPE
ncbi:MAG: hypothetical protein AB8G16_13055 [Gammaproteobacteria bacterium]